MKVGEVLPAGHPTSRAMAFFETRLEELSDGRIDVRLYPSGQIGDANQLIPLCQLGNVEACVVSTAPLAQHAELLNVLGMPFLFRDRDHQYATVDGPVGDRLRRYLKDKRLIAASFFDSGSRNLMTIRGPIRKPEDLKGLKIRVMSSAVLQATVERLGAMPQAMSQGEVYSALQTGVIDGWENNPATCRAFSMYETGCIHFAWTRHVAIPDVLLISRRWYDSLPADLRKAVDQAAEDTKLRQRELWQQADGESIAALKQAGMKFNDVERSVFESRFESFYQEYERRYGREFAELLRMTREQGTESL